MRQAIILALLAAAPALGQQAGTYNGKTSQGLPVTVVVAESGGQLVLSEIDAHTYQFCPKVKDQPYENILEDDAPIVNHRFSLQAGDAYVNFAKFSLFFKGNAVKGHLLYDFPGLTSPTGGCVLTSGHLTFTATLKNDAVVAPSPLRFRAVHE